MLVQTKIITTDTTLVSTSFELNHNPTANKVLIAITGITNSLAKQIDGRLHPDAPWTPLAYPTAASDTLTLVDLCSEYRILTQRSSGSQSTTINIGN